MKKNTNNELITEIVDKTLIPLSKTAGQTNPVYNNIINRALKLNPNEALKIIEFPMDKTKLLRDYCKRNNLKLITRNMSKKDNKADAYIVKL
jgi:hypothetical protein